MKYLNKLFASKDQADEEEDQDLRTNQGRQSSATALTSFLYSLTFTANNSSQLDETSARFYRNEVTLSAQSQRRRKLYEPKKDSCPTAADTSLLDQKTPTRKRQQKSDTLGAYLLTATVGKTTASTSAIASIVDIEEDQTRRNSCSSTDEDVILLEREEDNDDNSDWILLDDNNDDQNQQPQLTIHSHSASIQTRRRKGDTNQMALDKGEVELIKASWEPVRKDPVDSGVLLFKGLFTKFPQYLKFFPQFSDLDLERMHEHKRLLRHAKKVIDTVTFVVDSVGDDRMKDQLNEALTNLVKGHLQRRVGLTEFRNLGIVLIDFICDVNNRRGNNKQKAKSSFSAERQPNNDNDSETMTSALDKIRASPSPSSSSEEESYLRNVPAARMNNLNENSNNNQLQQDSGKAAAAATDSCAKPANEAKIDTNILVAAWTKLYGSILEVVKCEEEKAKQVPIGGRH